MIGRVQMSNNDQMEELDEERKIEIFFSILCKTAQATNDLNPFVIYESVIELVSSLPISPRDLVDHYRTKRSAYPFYFNDKSLESWVTKNQPKWEAKQQCQ